MYEPAVHLSSRTSCYLDILLPSPTTLEAADPPYTSDRPLLLTGKALGTTVLTRHLDHLPPPGRTQAPASLSAQSPSFRSHSPTLHTPRPLPLPAFASMSCSCLLPNQMAGSLKTGLSLIPPHSFRVTPSAAELATAGMPCPTTRELVSLYTFLGL